MGGKASLAVLGIVVALGLFVGISKMAGYDYVACIGMSWGGFRPVAETREHRFLGKVREDTARCRGDDKAVAFRSTPWVDWANYWATADGDSKSGEWLAFTGVLRHFLKDGFGIDGALMDLEYERIELIKFNLFDNDTFKDYVAGRDGVVGPAVKIWPEMRLPRDHPNYADLGVDDDGAQTCTGPLIRYRTLTGICNDLKNPAMGSTGQVFARNVPFEETFPRLGYGELIKNRHGDRIGLLQPDPQTISRKLFTRAQDDPTKCNQGRGLAGNSTDAACDYKKAPFFNVLAAFWIQFMNHDWFSHLNEGRNDLDKEPMNVGCPTPDLGCRPGDRMDRALFADESEPGTFEHNGKTRLLRARKTTQNFVTAWWDASQIYGYDERSRRRVGRDPENPARLSMVRVDGRTSAGDRFGYLPTFQRCRGDSADCYINPEWVGQEAVAFPDNWTIGLSFLHNLFVREHNAFVEAFQSQAAQTPNDDSGLRDPDNASKVIRYQDVSADELFQVARLVVAAEIAKIHTIEWTPQLLYDEPLHAAMNSNWYGLAKGHPLIEKALARVVDKLGKSEVGPKATSWYSVFASGPGIIGTGSAKKGWDLTNPDDVNGGVNHFGSPFNFPEEFITVYRLHALLPDLIEYRDLGGDPNVIAQKVPVVETFRGAATKEMRARGMANWGLSLGRQRLGKLALRNHPRFLQNLEMPIRLKGIGTETLDVAALDILRDRERGVPRFNEFRRQYGLKSLTSFDDFIDARLRRREGSLTDAEKNELADQRTLVKLLRQVYGTHKCNAKIITAAQVDDNGEPIDDCLGQPEGTQVDNIEDLDTVVGWLAETTRPHGFAISETQFQVFILNASRRLFSDRFFTSSFRPEFYSTFGLAWVNDNGPDGKVMETGEPNGHEQEVSPLKRILLRAIPELKGELETVINVFDPWARDRGDYYTLEWAPRPGAEADEAFARD